MESDLFEMAASGSHAAWTMTGRNYELSQDYANAIKWYTKAAEQGYSDAQNSLGLMYYLGKGVPQDYAKAFEWFSMASNKKYNDAPNNDDALYNLATMYYRGQGTPQDYDKAFELYTKAAKSQGAYPGNIEAMKALSHMYDYGLGAPKDHVKATQWHAKAATIEDVANDLTTPSSHDLTIPSAQTTSEQITPQNALSTNIAPYLIALIVVLLLYSYLRKHKTSSAPKAIAAIAEPMVVEPIPIPILYEEEDKQEAAPSVDFAKYTIEKITGQEMRLAECILQGLSTAEIAIAMKISENTVKSYRRSLYSKLDVKSKWELFKLAGKFGE